MNAASTSVIGALPMAPPVRGSRVTIAAIGYEEEAIGQLASKGYQVYGGVRSPERVELSWQVPVFLTSIRR